MTAKLHKALKERVDIRLAAMQLLTVADFAARLGISVWTARAWAYSGRITSVKVGARLQIPESEIERVIAAGTRPRITESTQAVEAR
ncbi:MAG TPA: helix-turn-helix domain-containing protein [Candidatus Sulfotelmatobacter sp.]|nr:helix-turn-helix domain-containing protein [Candidatus Sulfotelmatobacter sp.]